MTRHIFSHYSLSKMLLSTILAVLLCRSALALPHMGVSNEEFLNIIQKLGLGHRWNKSEKLTFVVNGNNADQVTNDKGELNKTVGEALLVKDQSSLDQADIMMRRTRNILEKFKPSNGIDISSTDFKDNLTLTKDHKTESNSTGSVTVTYYHYNPSLVQFNFFNSFPFDHHNPCDPNPCQNGGICKVDESGSGLTYQCRCPTPLGGKNCTEVECGGDHCFHYGNTVIYIYNDKQATFSQAKSQCEERNMSLVKIPDEDKNEFIRRALLKMYANDHTSQHCFFNGLYRTSTTGTFYWTDGSPFGNFRPWSIGKLEGQCVVLCTTTKFYFYWDIDGCNGEDTNWGYYYICERQLRF